MLYGRIPSQPNGVCAEVGNTFLFFANQTAADVQTTGMLATT